MDEIEYVDEDELLIRMAVWHSDRVRCMQELLSIDGDTPLLLKDEEMILKGEILKGFQTGIRLALMIVGELPFEIERVPENVVYH